MKDLIISALVTVVLILLFSTNGFTEDIPPLFDGNSPKYPGDSGTVLPGNGTEIVEVVIAESQETTEGATEGETESTVASEEIHITIKEEQKNMNDIVLAFWHGVATVLIGETVALMVAIAWMKIRRKDN